MAEKKTKSQYQKSKDMRKLIKKEHGLGFKQKKISEVNRESVGKREGSILHMSIQKWTDDQFNWFLERVRQYLPAEKQTLFNENMRNSPTFIYNTFPDGVCRELMSSKPNADNIKALFDPLNAKRKDWR